MVAHFYFGFIIAFGVSFLVLILFSEVFNAFIGSVTLGFVYGVICSILHRSPFNPMIKD